MNGYDAYKKHVNPVLAQLEEISGLARRFVKAENCRIWDEQGNSYLDFVSGHGSFNLGHNHPALKESLTQTIQADPINLYGFGPNPSMGELAERLALLSGAPLEIVFFSNSGSEAVEGALKIARAATKRSRILYCRDAYHGTTLGSLSMMEPGPLRKPFEPLLPDFVPIPFNDAAALEKKLADATNPCAAFVLEPLQAEGGVRLPSPGYLEQAARLCRQQGALLVLDEVQTGLGRTGSMFMYQQENVTPDIVTTAKSLGGGLVPIGAYITTQAVYDAAYGTYESCGIHHSTFGGNSICCRTALKTLELLAKPGFLEEVREKGELLLQTLRETLGNHPAIKNIRGRGLLLGIEFNQPDHPWLSWENLGMPGFEGQNPLPSLVMRQLLKHHVLTEPCGHDWSVLKIEPPLVIEKKDIQTFMEALEKTMEWLNSIT